MHDTSPGLRSAGLFEADRLGDVLAEAFHQDPGTIIFEPDPDRRARILPVFFRTWVVAAIEAGGDLVVPDEPAVRGLGSWFGPDRHGPGDAELEAAGFTGVLEAFGGPAAERMRSMTTALERAHERLAPWPHLRLDFLGVLPAAQGSGLASRLIDHGTRRADAEGLRCYLETFTRRNVAFYERRGWTVVDTYRVAGDVPVFAMVRPPTPPTPPAP